MSAMTGFYISLVFLYFFSLNYVFLSSFITFINSSLAVSLGIAPTKSFFQWFSQSRPHFGSIHNSGPSLAPFLSDGAVLVQSWAAQRLVARAGQYGAHGRCVSLSPHLWHGLRLSVVSTHPGTAPPLTLDPVMQLMLN